MTENNTNKENKNQISECKKLFCPFLKKMAAIAASVIVAIASISLYYYEQRLEDITKKHEAQVAILKLEYDRELNSLHQKIKEFKSNGSDLCSTIEGEIISPKNYANVHDEIIVKGKINNKLKRGFYLWLIVKDNKRPSPYIDARQIIIDNDKKEWEQVVSFIGSAVNHECQIELIIVNERAHSLLNQFNEKKEMPADRICCDRIDVKIIQ